MIESVGWYWKIHHPSYSLASKWALNYFQTKFLDPEAPKGAESVKNRLKGNDQEPIQSNSTSFPRHHAGKEPKHQDSIKSNSRRGQLLPSRRPPGHPKQNWQIVKRLSGSGHTITSRINYNRSTALEWSVKITEDLNRFHARATLEK